MAQSNNPKNLIQQLEELLKKYNFISKTALTVEEAAAYTGRSKSNLYKLTAQGIIPHSKPHGPRIYFNRLELDAWMLSKPITTAMEMEQTAITKLLFKTKGKTPRQLGR